ncbi:MAG TPA: YbhB/YbcL family Raf kinase inhibitor-like protein [Polyangiaceae bacterium]|jgi:Raf kinase inhibitor-like YbhB/YbcL family protein|nr:YbhB/YbcL family Raf kinase inhibitor-like protein [Polyangiaceae bacterium]
MKTLGWVAAGFVVSVAGCGGKSATVSSVDLPKLEVDLPTLEAGRVPDESVYGGGSGCTGADHSLGVRWRGAPAAAQSFAVILHDPDAPRSGGWYHWAVFDLPPSTNELPKGASSSGLPAGAKQGKNDFGDVRYGGPCPPPGAPHHYVAHVFALDVATLGLAEGADAKDVESAAKKHALAAGEATGTYGR